MVFFFSDNGGPISVNGSRNDPLRGAKGDVFEGGMRVPFVVKWPAKLKPGTVFERPVSSLDVFATSLSVAGAPMPNDRTFDSVDVIPYLTGEKEGVPHERLYWRTTRQLWAIRSGDLKLVRGAAPEDALFDLNSDIGESRDLRESQSSEASRLAAELERWNEELMAPAFPGAGGKKKPKKTGVKAKGGQ
ncbi:MAG: sulfatase-like hydrolase/transferase, partial [Verrucomicrobiae bacterium]|nr:sulfatase-like hydrolase/transferase [Verrucomicrobiae bacterium]